MQIVYHIGANCTDGDKLVRSLVKNSAAMEPRGIHIPAPTKYRRLLRETIQNLAGASPSEGTRDILIDAICDSDKASRIVMSNSAFLGTPIRVFEEGIFFGQLEMKIRALSLLFPQDELYLAIALRNPATIIPALWEQSKRKTFEQFMGGIDPMTLRWAEILTRIRATAPGAKLTVWCNEDTPMIWAEIMRRLIGVDPGTPLSGEYELLSTIMNPAGMKRFEAYLRTHPPQSEIQLRRVIAAFLDKYAIADEIEEEVDIPGWDAKLVDDLTLAYETEIAAIATMPGVDFIAP